jgi:putative ABC transport system permease protein
LLFRYPGLLVPLAVGSLLLAFTAAAHPLFVDASAGALLRDGISQPLVSRYGAGVSYYSSRLPLSSDDGRRPLYERRSDAFAQRTGRSPLLGPVISQVLGPEVPVSSSDGRGGTISARLFAGTAATGHVRPIGDHTGSGAWLPDLVATALDVGPGDTVALGSGDRRTELRVAGVYRSLYAQPPSGYWLQWNSEIYPYCPPGRDCASAPPQFILVSRTQALATYERLGMHSADFAWNAPVAAGLSLSRDQGRRLETFVEDMRRDASGRRSALGRILRCCTEPNMYGSVFGPQVHLSSAIGPVVQDMEARLVTVEGPARLVQVVGGFVALAVLGGAAAFAAAARRTELHLLAARGRGRLTVALKAAIEIMAPSVVGGAAGVALAIAAVGWIVGQGSLGSGALMDSVRGAAWAVAASICIGAVIAGAMSGWRLGSRAGVGAILGRIPWEVVILAVGFIALRDVQSQLADVRTWTADNREPAGSLFLLPLAAIGGFSILGARVFRSAARRLSSRSEEMRPSSYVAVHRLADSRGLVLVLFAATGLAMGTFVHGQTVARSLAETVDAKAGLSVGSDLAAYVTRETVIPPDFPLPATRVSRIPEAGTIEPGGAEFDLIGVDPETFPSVAAWHDALADGSLDELVERLRAGSSGPSPVIVVGGDPPDVVSVQLKGRTMPVVAVGSALAFPGMFSHRLTIVMNVEALERTSAGGVGVLDDVNTRTEIWVQGDPERAHAALRRLPVSPYGSITLEEVKDIPYISAVIEMFDILRVVGLGAAILVLAALAMYLQARSRSQLVGYGLSIRMGMAHRRHRQSLFLETVAVLTASSLVGMILALPLAFVLIPLLDPIKAIPPAPLFLPPALAMVVALVAVTAASWGAAWFTELRARHAPLGEVLRVDG